MAKPFKIVRGRQINPLTGEVADNQDPIDVLVDTYWRRDHAHDRSTGNATRYTTPYTLFFRPVFRLLATHPKLRSGDLKVLFLLCEQIDHKTELIAPDYPALTTITGVKENAIRNAIGRLVKVGVLVRPFPGRIGFNPHYVWCGGAGRREQIVAATEER